MARWDEIEEQGRKIMRAADEEDRMMSKDELAKLKALNVEAGRCFDEARRTRLSTESATTEVAITKGDLDAFEQKVVAAYRVSLDGMTAHSGKRFDEISALITIVKSAFMERLREIDKRQGMLEARIEAIESQRDGVQLQ